MQPGAKEVAVEIVCRSPENIISDKDSALLHSVDRGQITKELVKLYHKEKRYSISKTRAYNALKMIKDIDVVQVISDIFNKSPIDWRVFLCDELASYPGPRTATLLSGILVTDKDANVRYSAAEALGVVGDTTCIPALEYTVQHDKGTDFEGRPVAREAARSLENIRTKYSSRDTGTSI